MSREKEGEKRVAKHYILNAAGSAKAGCRVTVIVEGESADYFAELAKNEIKKENRRRKLHGDSPIDYSIWSSENATSISP